MEEESIVNTNNVTTGTFSNTYITKVENANTILISENLDKLDDLVDAVKNLTINDGKYYGSKTATLIDAQDDLTRNQEIVTRNSNGNEKLTHTINADFEKNIE